jgi:hypothetical protein
MFTGKPGYSFFKDSPGVRRRIIEESLRMEWTGVKLF